MFSTALAALDIEPEEALMVGDRASHDGGAVALRIDTLTSRLPKRSAHEAWTSSSGCSEVFAIYMARLVWLYDYEDDGEPR